MWKVDLGETCCVVVLTFELFTLLDSSSLGFFLFLFFLNKHCECLGFFEMSKNLYLQGSMIPGCDQSGIVEMAGVAVIRRGRRVARFHK